MKTEEILKKEIVESRMELALLMNNASQNMSDLEFEELESKVRQIHIYDLNKDFEMSLSETNKLVEKLKNELE
jgi:hypothetical protein